MNLFLLFLMQLGLVVSVPVQKVITNHCDGQDCEINIQYHDESRELSLKTNSTDSVLSAHFDIAIPRDGSSDQNDLVSLMENVVQMLSSMMQTRNEFQQLENSFQNFEPIPEPDIPTTQTTSMQDCSTAPATGQYTISPFGAENNPFLVVCDVDTTSGGWIVIQRRFDGSVDFDRNWVDYENGFGSLDGEFWLGLSKMHTLTNDGTWKVRFDLEDFAGNNAYAEYNFFQVGDSDSSYRLIIASYSGTAGDGMTGQHNLSGMEFTTKDRDNDDRSGVNCAMHHSGGWWYNNCANVVVNGRYLGQGDNDTNGMTWYFWRRSEVLKKVEMKIQRID